MRLYSQILQKETYKLQQSEVLDQGLNIITGNDIRVIGEPECIYTDPMTEVRSIYYRVSVKRSMSYADLMKMNKKG